MRILQLILAGLVLTGLAYFVAIVLLVALQFPPQ